MLYPCLCCGYLTRSEPPNGEFDICPVCYWEDDPWQSEDYDLEDCANTPSLNQARENFKKYGAMEERYLKHVRKPYNHEIP
ncbi:CPCC family cysteine-rich protein [Acinetobacter sp. ANC 5383]